MKIDRRLFAAGMGALALPRPAFANPYAPALVNITSGQQYYTYTAAKVWAFYRPHPNVFRFEIQTGDRGWVGDPVGVRHRDEVSAIMKYPYDAVVWQSWSQLIEPGHPTLNGFVICNQWHNSDTTVGRSPCVQFDYCQESMSIYTDSQAVVGPDGNFTSFKYYQGPMPKRGVWHSFVARYEFGNGRHGSLRVWMNGQIIVDLPTKPIGAWSDAQGPYNKFGVYCADGAMMPPAFAINYANMQIGYEDMRPLITNPLPTPKWTWGNQPT